VRITAHPAAGALFLGWVVDGVARAGGATLDLALSADHVVVANFAPRPAFADVAPGDPAAEAIAQLAARGIIRGYGDGRFGPDDTVLRAQLAALLARAIPSDVTNGPCVGRAWDCEDWGNPFTDRGAVDGDLWRNAGTLAHYGVARGYGDGTYNPTGEALRAQVVSLVTRVLVMRGDWQEQPADPGLYGGVLRGSGHEADVATYLRYAGPLPGATVGSP